MRERGVLPHVETAVIPLRQGAPRPRAVVRPRHPPMLGARMSVRSLILAGITVLGMLACRAEALSALPIRAHAALQQEAAVARADGVQGTVLRPDGTPAAGAKVTLWALRAAWPAADRVELESAITGNDGAFRFGTASGPCQHLSCEHPYFAGDDLEVRQDVVVHELRLRAGFRVVGLVQTDGGRPARGATVALEPQSGEAQQPIVVGVDESGRFLLDNVPRGDWRLVARHPDWQPAALPGVVVGASQLLVLQLRNPALALAGRVESGQPPKPLGGAQVRAWPQGATGGVPLQAETDADGRFVLRGLARGPVRVDVLHPGHSTSSRVVAVDGTSVPIAIELVPRSRVRGQLRPASPGVLASAGNLELVLRTRSGELHSAQVLPDGTFEFAQPVSAGVATLVVHAATCSFARSGESSMTVRVEEGADSELQLDVVAASIVRGRILDGKGAPASGVKLYVRFGDQLTTRLRDAGSALLDRDLRRLGDQFTRVADADLERLVAVSVADGSWTMRGLASGSLLVRTECPGYASHRFRVSVPKAGEEGDAGDQYLPPPCELSGRVLRGDRGVAGAVLTASSGGTSATTISAADGAYRFEDLPPGSYRIRARWANIAASVSTAVVVTPGNAAEGITVEFPAGRTVIGMVRSIDGRPVEGATVVVVGGMGVPVTSDEQGRFELELPNGDCELRVFLGESAAETTFRLGATQSEADIRLAVVPTMVLRGTVRMLPTRRSPRGVLLRCEPSGRPADRIDRWVDLDGGQLRYPWFPAVRCRLEVWCEGFVPHVRDVDLSAGGELDLGELLLEPGSSFACMVVDEEGRPVPDCLVFSGRDGDQSLYLPGTRTDANGCVVVGGISSVSRTIVVAAPGHARFQFDLSIPRDIVRREPMVVRVQPGATIEVSGAGAAGSLVALVLGGRIVATADVGLDGTATFVNQPPGDYEVQLIDDIGRSARFEVRTGQPRILVELN